MKWLKVVIISSLFLILMPFVIGGISIEIPDKDVYNLGEKITASVSIIESQDYAGFLKVILECGDYDLQYYTTPLNLEANFRTQVQVPELPLFESMKGNCNIRADFEDTNGDRISRAQSKTFLVTDELNLSTSKIIDALPNENVALEGNVKKINGENLQAGNIKISFMNKEFDTKVDFGNFKYSLALDDLDIGNYPILIAVEDKHKNYANAVVQLNVLPIATRIENRLESETVKPGTALKAKIILYDHKDRAMNGTIDVDLTDPNGKKLVSKKVESLDSINYEFSRTALPGVYTIISEMEELRQETQFEVEAVKQISMSYEDEIVIVENTGNVDYDDETTIILESGDKKYLINKKITLKPGETTSIDLSKEVPAGSYDVILPQAENASVENETVVEQSENIIEDVTISDNRPVYKKAGSVMGLVTGAVVKTGGYVASRPLMASIILIIIIVLIVLYYSRDLVINKLRKKKSEDTSELFKDYEYEEEEKSE